VDQEICRDWLEADHNIVPSQVSTGHN